MNAYTIALLALLVGFVPTSGVWDAAGFPVVEDDTLVDAGYVYSPDDATSSSGAIMDDDDFEEPIP